MATNRPYDLDEAMHRRIMIAIEFRQPDHLLRKAIWESHIPEQMKLADDANLVSIVYVCVLLWLRKTLAQYEQSIYVYTKCVTSTSLSQAAPVAQWLEHWSCKPGVRSSSLLWGFCIFPKIHTESSF